MSIRPTRRGFLATSGLLAGAAVLGGRATAAAAGATSLSRTQVIADTRRAADYWLSRTPMYSNDNNWHNATFHSGNMALYRLTQDVKYRDFSKAWAEHHDYQLMADGSTPFHADHEAAGQVYLDLYALDPQPHYIDATVNRISAQIAGGRTNYWTWVDALHMAMPVFARLGVLKSSTAHLDYLYNSYTYTKSQTSKRTGLWSPTQRLWWRDNNYVRSSTYWSRGNGWSIAAHAKVLAALPSTAAHYSEYADNLRSMAAALKPLQRADGFWNASLTDPVNYAGPETSGTAFFTYGLAYGINHGLLDAATYLPVVERAWQGMISVALRSDGLLGYVQGPGAKPSDNYPWSATSTQPYGVGAFLLAGTEVAALAV
ncbi:glycoside hydrolase family 88 protein [Planotetraspora sp. GP83]|uniref:glycoside hydrolase family 88/105 protein n=1 Tax=Planotetraspora sp. GP83 TaxID=3156264 RepID=UPI00351426CE